ncbi:g12634 [Coccomyxa viridis]|uniref:G12634 protein n=1 Tax=Coccomyxa viridis TaxID=1274662 RepID=A0ABP1GGC4_9CHLO
MSTVAQRSRDLPQLRADTPGCQHIIHFNNAGAALPIKEVVDIQHAFLDSEALCGGYETVITETEALQLAYNELATMLNCSARNIAILQSATAAWMQVFYGIPFQSGDRILTGVHEYAANYIAFLQVAKRTGAKIEVIPETADNDVNLEALEHSIVHGQGRPALLAFTHIPTNSGRVYSAEGIGAIAKRHGVPFLLDACQSVGQMPLNVAKLGCNWLSGTSRKYLRGPRGVGFLYASDKAMQQSEPAALDMWGAEWVTGGQYRLQPGARRYEQYERCFAAVAGLGVAARYANELGVDWIWERVQELAAELRSRLRSIPGVTVHDRGRLLCGIVSFTKDGVDSAQMKAFLLKKMINVSISPMTSTRLDFEKHGLPESVVRASVHYYNSSADIEQLAQAVSDAHQ